MKVDMSGMLKRMSEKKGFVDPAYAMRMYKDDDLYRERCKAQCREWARANRTDPFAYDRALNEYATGLAFAGVPTGSLFAGAEGYNVGWSQEPQVAFLGEQAVEYYSAIPINLKRP